MLRISLAIAALFQCALATADVRLARVFSDHLVLQQGVTLPVWGTAAPGEHVAVTLDKIQRTVTADKDGNWLVRFPPRDASATPITISVSGDHPITVQDVLVGEVWICAGQSNMEWPLERTADAKADVAAADDPQIRLLNLRGAARGGSGRYTREHLDRLTPERFCSGSWEVCKPDSARSFSGVGYFFGRRLHKELGVPIGLIMPAIGGTPAEAWIRRSALASDPRSAPMVRGNWLENQHLGEWCRQRAVYNFSRAIKDGDEIPGDDLGPNHSFKPAFMWQAGIEPLIPYAIRGVIWYQGESNAESPARVRQHEYVFPTLIRDWRREWGQGDFPFLYVQLPGMGRPDWPEFREGQRRLLRTMPNVGMAVTIDVGHPTNVHPTDKQSVGDRLARWALGTTYESESKTAYSGPLYRAAAVDGNSIRIHFDHVGQGLTSKDSQSLRHFEIAGADGVYRGAVARIDGKTVVATSELVPSPRQVRYAWTAYPKPPVNFYNRDGFPASPFTTEGLALTWSSLPDLPDEFGFGGPMVGAHNGALIVAGGANFPNGPPWPAGHRPAGTKTWHDRVFVLEPGDTDWRTGSLPKPLAYAPAVSTDEGMVILGGETYGRLIPHNGSQPEPVGTDGKTRRGNFAVSDVVLVKWNAALKSLEIDRKSLPPLPKPSHYHSAALIDDVIYVLAAHAENSSSDRLDSKSFWALDLSKPKAERRWEHLPTWPGAARHKMAVAVQRDATGRKCLYMFSGSTWAHTPDGEPDLGTFQFFADAYRFEPTSRKWERIADLPPVPDRRIIDLTGYGFDLTGKVWHRLTSGATQPQLDISDLYRGLPRPVAASAAVAVGDSQILLVGGATGRYVTLDLADRPLFPRDVLCYDTRSNQWDVAGRMPLGVVTTSAVKWNGRIVIPTGEIRPGVRTPKVQAFELEGKSAACTSSPPSSAKTQTKR